MSDVSKRPTHKVLVGKKSKDGKFFYTQIGVAWSLEKGGLSVSLDLVPVADPSFIIKEIDYDKKKEGEATDEAKETE